MQCVQDSFLPETLASICNDIKFVPGGDSRDDCQVFVYDVQKIIVFFKPHDMQDLPANSSPGTDGLCAHPTAYTWLLTANQG